MVKEEGETHALQRVVAGDVTATEVTHHLEMIITTGSRQGNRNGAGEAEVAVGSEMAGGEGQGVHIDDQEAQTATYRGVDQTRIQELLSF